MKHIFFLLLASSVFAVSCTKTAPDPVPSRENMLRKGKWKLSSSKVTLTGPNGKRTIVDYGPYRNTCITDNTLRFDSLTRGAILNGSVKCSAADGDSIGFVWQLKNNEQNIDLYNFYLLIDSLGQSIAYDATNDVYKWVFSTSATRNVNLVNAELLNFSQSAFTISYTLPGVYLDTTGGNRASPVIKPDVFNYQITYSNF